MCVMRKIIFLGVREVKNKLINTSFSVVFPRQAHIRRKAYELEDRLKNLYLQPEILPVPDEIDPEMPRIIFSSHHGYSQLIVSQVNIQLTAFYSPDWQENMELGKKYFMERSSLIFNLLDLIGDIKPYFCGITNRAQINIDTISDKVVLKQIANTFLKELSDNTSDIEVKNTKIVDNRFYSNIIVRNFRTWEHNDHQEVIRLSNKGALKRGIEVICDFNDRYAFNEIENYFSDKSILNEIIERGFTELNSVLAQFRE
ncbi:hypothetical protein CTH_2642 [Carboxydocella thermautotrophica]|nr:hypothetical protein CTH_2642 [Carboxydocella thermautotrophica]